MPNSPSAAPVDGVVAAPTPVPGVKAVDVVAGAVLLDAWLLEVVVPGAVVLEVELVLLSDDVLDDSAAVVLEVELSELVLLSDDVLDVDDVDDVLLVVDVPGVELVVDVVLVVLDVVVVVVIGGGQLIQNVLCFCGSWTNWSLKCSPCELTAASPFASALLTSVATLMTLITWEPPSVVLYTHGDGPYTSSWLPLGGHPSIV